MVVRPLKSNSIEVRRCIAVALVVLLCDVSAESAATSVVYQGDRALNWRFDEIRAVSGASDTVPFGAIRSIASDGRSRFAVLDRTTLRFYVFDSTGRFQWFAGRAGDGPGELRTPISVNAGPDGGFFVTDQRHIRVSSYAPGGVHRKDISLPGNDRYVFENTALPADWFVALRQFADPVAEMFQQKLFRWRGDSVEVLASYDFKLRPRIQREVCPGIGDANDNRPLYEPELLFSTNGSVIAWRGGWADYRIRIRDATGAQREIRRGIVPVSVTEQMAIAANGGRERVVQGCRIDRLPSIRARGWADARPVVQRIAMLPDGSMWVSRFGAAADTLVDVFDARGAYAGTLPKGTLLPNAFLTANHALYRGTTAAGEPIVRIVRISR